MHLSEYQPFNHFFTMTSMHEGESLKAFIEDKGPLKTVIENNDITRAQLNWLFGKSKLKGSEKRKAVSWIQAVWPDAEASEIFEFSPMKNTIVGDGNIQASDKAKVKSGSNEKFYLERISQLEEQIEVYKETIRTQKETIEAQKKLIEVYQK